MVEKPRIVRIKAGKNPLERADKKAKAEYGPTAYASRLLQQKFGTYFYAVELSEEII